MALRRKNKAAKAPRYNRGRVILGAAFFFSVISITFLSFISMQLALLAFGFMAFSCLMLYDRLNRENWERSVNFKFKIFGEKHDALAREVLRGRNEMDDLKSDVREAMREKTVSYKDLQKAAEKPRASGLRAAPDAGFDLEVMPAAIKPKRTQKKTQAASANDSAPATKTRQRTPVVVGDGEGLSDMVVGELLQHALRNKRIDVFVQPIQRLPQRQTRFYEIFARVRAKPGIYIPAGRYKKMADEQDVMKDIDSLLLVECLKTLRQTAHFENAPPFFVNVDAQTLKNAQFMGKLVAFIGKNRDLAARLVFEISQEDYQDMPIPVLQIMAALGKLGCHFSIDHVTSLDIDINDLQRFNVRFVKAPVKMFIDAAQSEKSYRAIWKHKRLLEGNGIGLIVEKIEDEAMLRELLDYDIHYGQGFLFGKPDVQGAYEPQFQRRSIRRAAQG